MVALLSCWKWLSDSGTVLVVIVAMVDSGTGVPSDVRDVVVEQLIGVEPVALLHLRDHLVGAAVEAEVIDVAAAQHPGQRAADVAHLQAELRGLVAVDLDGRLRLVDLQIGVEEDEHAALRPPACRNFCATR